MSAVMPVSFHSAISGPFSWTAGGAIPPTPSARSLASGLAVWPAIDVCCHSPPAAVNISPSLAMAAASEPLSHWCNMLVLGLASADAKPKTNMLHQWDSGSDAAAIAKLGEMFTAAGGEWQQTSIAGHTANPLAKLRADGVGGIAPPAVQLKGPE